MATNKLINMAVQTSTYGAELLTAENASAARVLLGVSGGGGGGDVSSVNGQVGAVVLTYSDVGAASAAQGALAETALQPGDAPGDITSVNGKTGVVVLTAADVGAATTAQGAKADTALQPGDIPAQAVTSVNTKTGAVVLTASDVGAATAAQGALASTAVQPGSLATVATTGSYNSLSNLPTLGTAAAQSASYFATAAQGALAATAVQPSTALTKILGYQGTDDFIVSGSNSVEISLGIRNTGGGTPVFHYYYSTSSGGMPASGVLIGGAGSRPWAGSTWSDHSTAAYHLLTTEQHTTSAQGTDFAVLATPIGGLQSSRIYVARFNGDGDLIMSNGQTSRRVDAGTRGRGPEVLRPVNAEMSLVGGEGLGALYRGYACGGTTASPTASIAGCGAGLSFSGHDGTSWHGANALIRMNAASTFTSTSRETEVDFETTASGATARAVRLRIKGNGAVFILNSTVRSDTPSGGGYLYVESGALKYKGSSGTVTTIAPA